MPNTTHMHIPSNRARDIERYCHSELAGLYPEREIGAMCDLLFEAFVGWSKAQLLAHRDDTVDQSDLLKFHWAVEDLKRYRPIQYIIGQTSFCGLPIHVAPGVLIPRPETEEIVERTKRLAANPRRILDLCTGSGCMALALAAHFREAAVYGVDISTDALAIAKGNAAANGLEVTFVQCDLLSQEPTLPDPCFDLIVSNPPYVREMERAEMEPNVLDHEPALALFVPDGDALRFYRAIGQYASQHLAHEGLLVLEINEHLGATTCQLLEQMGFDTTLYQDFRGKDRCIVSTFKV